MKIALITDTHFGARNDSQFFLDNFEKFYREIFFPKLDEEGITDVLILGDTFEHRKTLNAITFYRARKMFFDELYKRNIQVKMLIGNHDVAYKNTNEVNWCQYMEAAYPNLKVVYHPAVYEFDGLPIAMISWINPENLQDSLEFIRTVNAPILCGHFEIKTFEMMKGQPCLNGFDKEVFNRFEAVFSGHFHVISTDGRITYLSNPSQTNWGDYGLKKGFWILDTATREYHHIENPFEVYGKIVYTEEISVIDFDYSKYQDKMIRVYIQSFAQTNQQKLNLFLEKLNTFAHNTEVFEIDDSLTGTLDESALDFTNTNAVIEQYIDDVIQNDLVDKNQLKGIFMGLYTEAMETAADTE